MPRHAGTDTAAVAEAIVNVADRELAPRFGRLRSADVSEKAPGEVVTEADRACERALTAALQQIRDIPVVGEEAAADDTSLTSLVRTAEAVWLVDPLDGTGNFVAGSEDHSVMVSLVEAGTTVASWMWHPQAAVMAHAERGRGAWLDGERVVAPTPPRDPSSLRGVVKRRFLPEDLRARVDRNRHAFAAASDGRHCAGLDYPDLVRGAVDFLFYWRTLPWDHAPGVLFAEEAGLRGGRVDGTHFQPGDDTAGLIVAHHDVWHLVQHTLLGDGPP